jgi:hypothetical protein
MICGNPVAIGALALGGDGELIDSNDRDDGLTAPGSQSGTFKFLYYSNKLSIGSHSTSYETNPRLLAATSSPHRTHNEGW